MMTAETKRERAVHWLLRWSLSKEEGEEALKRSISETAAVFFLVPKPFTFPHIFSKVDMPNSEILVSSICCLLSLLVSRHQPFCTTWQNNANVVFYTIQWIVLNCSAGFLLQRLCISSSNCQFACSVRPSSLLFCSNALVYSPFILLSTTV